MINEKICRLTSDEFKNFRLRPFKIRNCICMALIMIISIGGSLIYGELVTRNDSTLYTYGIFIYYLVVLLINTMLTTVFYSLFLKITEV